MKSHKTLAVPACLLLCALLAGTSFAAAKKTVPKKAAVKAEPAITMELVDRMIDGVAVQLIGTPYVLGAKGPGSFDCASFITYIFKYMGVKSVSGTSRELAGNTKWPAINDISQIMRGDLLFFGSPNAPQTVSHVALYLGEGLFIHCSVASGGVAIQDFYSAFHYYKFFIGARRLVKDIPSGTEMGIPADMMRKLDELGDLLSSINYDYGVVSVPVTELGVNWAIVYAEETGGGMTSYEITH